MNKQFILALLALLLGGCVERYTPAPVANPPDYLVVESTINLRGVTTARLTRTRSLASAATPTVTGAMVSVVDETGTSYPLAEQGKGNYASAALTLDPARRYQLQVRTAAGRHYASDLVTGQLAPPIDSVTWHPVATGYQVYVSSHDPTAATRHYRWQYIETWAFHSYAQSVLVQVGDTILPRTDDIYHCWQSDTSRSILQFSTTQLSQSVASRYPLRLLPATSDRLGILYSILVRQYGETAEEYAYWDQLRKNSETVGSLFDPLPSQVSGNVHCLDDTGERVLGYVGATSVTEQRLFIDRNQLPLLTRFQTGYEECPPLDTILLKDARRVFSKAYLPVYRVTRRKDGYAGGTAECIDCRKRGTNVKPSYWP